MIYSPDNNFLLLKNYKVGGSSLEIALTNIVPENATCTELKPSEYGHMPRNHIYDNIELENHASYYDICDIFGEEKINNTISVVFVRHPYEIVASWYFHKMKEYWGEKTNDNADPFEYGGGYDWDALSLKQKDYLNKMFFYGKETDFRSINSTKWIYAPNGEILVDHVLRYENGIENEINKILPMVGLPKITIPYKAKSKYKPQHITYKNMFGKQELETIQKEWSWEFEIFGYEP
jgi:hypothetical protein